MEYFFVAFASAGLIFSWVSTTTTPVAAVDACAGHAQYATIATQNAATLGTAPLAPFGRIEAGWKIYAPQVGHAIGTPCAPDSKAFAATLAAWQSQHRLAPTGAMTQATLSAMKSAWQHERPFIAEFEHGACPAAPAESSLATVTPREGWLGKISKLDPRALVALRSMVQAARADDPRIATDSQMLTIVSAFRSPAYDAARCAAEHNCNGTVRARCSAHRTGTAVDLYIGALPGQSPVGSDDANRLYQTQTPAYRWLVKNGARFGFVNYVFEPWHWEWIGKSAPQMTASLGPKSAEASAGLRWTSLLRETALTKLTAKFRTLFASTN